MCKWILHTLPDETGVPPLFCLHLVSPAQYSLIVSHTNSCNELNIPPQSVSRKAFDLTLPELQRKINCSGAWRANVTDKPLKCLARTPKTRRQLFKDPEILELADLLAAPQCCALSLQVEINVSVLKCFSMYFAGEKKTGNIVFYLNFADIVTVFLVPVRKCRTTTTHRLVLSFQPHWTIIGTNKMPVFSFFS